MDRKDKVSERSRKYQKEVESIRKKSKNQKANEVSEKLESIKRFPITHITIIIMATIGIKMTSKLEWNGRDTDCRFIYLLTNDRGFF